VSRVKNKITLLIVLQEITMTSKSQIRRWNYFTLSFIVFLSWRAGVTGNNDKWTAKASRAPLSKYYEFQNNLMRCLPRPKLLDIANKERTILPWICSSTDRPIKSRIRNIAGHKRERLVTGPACVVHCCKNRNTLTHCEQISAPPSISSKAKLRLSLLKINHLVKFLSVECSKHVRK